MGRRHVLVALRLSLAHHPLCHHFASDRFGPFCSGCCLFVPAFAVTTPMAVAALLAGGDPSAMFLAGAVLGLPQLAALRRRWGRLARAAVKLLGGAGVGIANVGLVMLPVPLAIKLALLAMELAAFAGLLAHRMRSILATCHACPWRRDWEACPGFVPGAPRAPPVRAWRPDQQDIMRSVDPPASAAIVPVDLPSVVPMRLLDAQRAVPMPLDRPGVDSPYAAPAVDLRARHLPASCSGSIRTSSMTPRSWAR